MKNSEYIGEFLKQYNKLLQLRPTVRSAVFGNVGTVIACRFGTTEAEILCGECGKEFAIFRLTDLPRYQALTLLHEAGEPSPPCTTRMVVPLAQH